MMAHMDYVELFSIVSTDCVYKGHESYWTKLNKKPSTSAKLNKKHHMYQDSTGYSASQIQQNHKNQNISELQSNASDESNYIEPSLKTELFYKQTGLSFEEVITNFKERDVVLTNKYNYESLPHMEHYFILLYYGIKQYTIEQLQHLWIKLYNLYYNKTEWICVYIDLKTGQTPTNINIFNILFDQQVGIDLYKLKSVIKQFYYQYNPKCIQSPETQAIKSMCDNVLISDISMETVPHDCKVTIGYNGNECMSVVDETFPFLQSNVIHMSRCPSVEAPITQFAEDENDNTIFGFVKPKTAVVAGVFGIVATVGMKILGANNYRVN